MFQLRINWSCVLRILKSKFFDEFEKQKSSYHDSVNTCYIWCMQDHRHWILVSESQQLDLFVICVHMHNQLSQGCQKDTDVYSVDGQLAVIKSYFCSQEMKSFAISCTTSTSMDSIVQTIQWCYQKEIRLQQPSVFVKEQSEGGLLRIHTPGYCKL